MFSSFIFSILLIGVTSALPTENTKSLNIEITEISNITSLKEKDPGIKITPLQKSTVKFDTSLGYAAGHRIKGDRLVFSSDGDQEWGYDQNIQLQLKYPTSGQGKIVSYVEFHIQQSSSAGRAYISSGGIGQRSIVFIVEADSTFYVNYSAKIYGY